MVALKGALNWCYSAIRHHAEPRRVADSPTKHRPRIGDGFRAIRTSEASGGLTFRCHVAVGRLRPRGGQPEAGADLFFARGAARGVVSFRFNERVTETRNRQPEVGVVVGIAVGQLDRPYRAYLLGEGPQEHDPFGDLRGSLGLAQCARGAAGARRRTQVGGDAVASRARLSRGVGLFPFATRADQYLNISPLRSRFTRPSASSVAAAVRRPG